MSVQFPIHVLFLARCDALPVPRFSFSGPHRALLIVNGEGNLSRITSTDALGKHVPVVDARIDKKLSAVGGRGGSSP